MRQLIISNYDSSFEFTYVVIDNGNEIERGEDVRSIAKYGLYDKEWLMFAPTKIDFEDNKLIQEFDMIILCDDGDISIYKKNTVL